MRDGYFCVLCLVLGLRAVFLKSIPTLDWQASGQLVGVILIPMLILHHSRMYRITVIELGHPYTRLLRKICQCYCEKRGQ